MHTYSTLGTRVFLIVHLQTHIFNKHILCCNIESKRKYLRTERVHFTARYIVEQNLVEEIFPTW
uniref:Uncharacterized protein n=1 Tax=Octopus bimaculoides TaxID=37653 RepID=A0A0L8HUF2_OCTBM